MTGQEEETSFRGTGGLEEALAQGSQLLLSDPAAAAAQAREILRVNPHQADALRLLGAALRRTGRHEEAEQAELEAIAASAYNPVLTQAALHIRENRLNAAEHLLRPWLASRPFDAAALGMLAEIAARVGALADAESLLRNALKLAPAFASARLRLARVLYLRNRLPESLEVLDALLRTDPANPRAQGTKAATLGRIGDYDEAVALYEDLLERKPDNPSTWMSYGHILNTVGRLDESVAAYRRATALDPAFGEAWWSLANLKTVRFGEEDVALMLATLEREGLSADSRLHLHFALGKALEDAGDYARSFVHYEEGNRIRRGMLGYEPAATTAHVRRSVALYTPDFLAAREGQGCPSPDPIFVVGLPRAGSTLIEQILSSHSMVEGTSELPHLPSLTRRLEGERGEGGERAYPELVADLDPASLAALGEEYLRNAALHRKTGKPLFVDKLPNNWLHIGFIHLILPRARIIDARRHPLGCCFSNFKQHFARGQGFTYALEDVGLYYADYVRLLAHFDAVLPGRIHRVLHEDVVDDPEREVRRLLAYLDLPFEESCLRFHENARAVRTPSAGQVRRPINREGVERWRAYEPWLDPLKRALGPVLDHYPSAPPPGPEGGRG